MLYSLKLSTITQTLSFWASHTCWGSVIENAMFIHYKSDPLIVEFQLKTDSKYPKGMVIINNNLISWVCMVILCIDIGVHESSWRAMWLPVIERVSQWYRRVPWKPCTFSGFKIARFPINLNDAYRKIKFLSSMKVANLNQCLENTKWRETPASIVAGPK